MKGAHDEARLIARCKRELPHQHRAFEELIERYQNKVYTLCYRMLGNATDAEDVMQEILMKVFVTLHSFEERSAFSTWLYRVAHNQCLNYLAKGRQDSARDDTYSREGITRAQLDSKETSLAMQQSLLQLDKEQRSVLIMKYVLDLEVREIAEALGIGQSAVKMRLLRAREELRALYAGAP